MFDVNAFNKNNKNENGQEPNKGDIMSNIINVSEMFANVADKARSERKAGTLRHSELKKVMKQKKNEITAVRDQEYLVLKEVEGDEIAELQVKQHADLEVKRIEAKYKSRQKSLLPTTLKLQKL